MAISNLRPSSEINSARKVFKKTSIKLCAELIKRRINFGKKVNECAFTIKVNHCENSGERKAGC